MKMDSASFLSDVFFKAREETPDLSMRGFAKAIGLSASHLSDVMNRRKTLSLRKAREIGRNLLLGEAEHRYWLSLVSLDLFGEDKHALGSLVNEVSDPVAIDRFDVLSHWYILPILELSSTRSCDMDPNTVAKRIGIPPMDASMALMRLERYGLIERTKKGVRRTHRKIVFRSDESQANLQRFHTAMLKRAVEALATQTNSEKYVGTETMAFDPDDLGKMKAAFEECFDKVTALATRGKNRSEVYHMGIQFFRLTK